MNHLLALRLHDNDVAVLLQDWTASCLIEHLLEDTSDGKSESLRQLLFVDPSWLLWSIVNLQGSMTLSECPIAAVANCGDQLIRTVVADRLTYVCLSDDQLQRLQRHQIRAIHNGRLASQLALAKNEAADAELNFVIGALLESDQLLLRTGEASSDQQSIPPTLPIWLTTAFQTNEFEDIASKLQPIDSLEGPLSSGECSKLVPSSESNAWHVQFPPIRTLLPKLIEHVRQAANKTSNFQEKLELEKLAALKELAYGASHEINNPLANISTRAQGLIRNESDPDRKRQLATITSQAYRAHEMIADMMLFAKPPKPEFASMNLVSFLKDLTKSIQDDIDVACAHVVAHLPSDPILVLADAAQLDAAFRAIVKNSVEATGGGGNVEIRVRMPNHDRLKNGVEPFVEIEFYDDGPGISSEVRRHIFDPFYSGREAGRGLGFGLSKAWRIVELHDGQIAVKSDAGIGTSFSVFLPKSQTAK